MLGTEAPPRGPSGPEAEAKTPEAGAADETLRVVLTNLENHNVDAFARQAAYEEMSKKHEGPFWKRLVKSAWHTLTHEYQVVKKTQEKRQEIIENRNLGHHLGIDDKRWREAVAMRRSSEYAEHLLRDGETFQKLDVATAKDDKERQDIERIKSDIQDALERYVKGEIVDRDDLKIVEDQMVEAWAKEGIGKEFIGEGRFLAFDLGQKAEMLKGMVDSADGLDAVGKENLLKSKLENMEIVTGEARVGSNVEIDSAVSERVAEKLRRVPFLNEGRIARVVSALGNETVIAGMVSGLAYIGKRGLTAAGQVLVPGAAAALVAGIREANALIRERDLEGRRADSGQGLEITPDMSKKERKAMKARMELVETMYEATPAHELLSSLGELYNEHGDLKIESREDLNKAIKLQAQIRARIQLGDQKGARLIGFSDVEGMEGERFDLDLAMAKLDTDLRKLFTNDAAKTVIGIGDQENFDELFEAQKSIAIGMIEGHMDAKDVLFKELLRKRILKRAAAAAFGGAAVGYAATQAGEAAQWAYSKASAGASSAKEWVAGRVSQRISPKLVGHMAQDGDFPDSAGLNGGDQPFPDGAGLNPDFPDSAGLGNDIPPNGGSPTESFPGGAGLDADFPDSAGLGDQPERVGSFEGVDSGSTIQLSETSKLTLPEGYTTDSDGKSITIITPEGERISGITLEKDGSLSTDSQVILRSKGFMVGDSRFEVAGKPNVTTETVTAKDFVNRHRGELQKINITQWMVNAKPESDLNELGLQNRMDSQGNIIISVKGMTEGGSFNGKSGVNWAEAAKNGHLKVYLSPSSGAQSHAIVVQFKPDGTAVIDKDSTARSMFDKNGKFINGYQRAAVSDGIGADGKDNIAVLATVVGDREQPIRDRVVTPTWQTAHHYTLTPPPTAPVAATATAAPPSGFIPTIPIVTRRRVGQAQPAAASAGGPSEPNTGPIFPPGPRSEPQSENSGSEQANRGSSFPEDDSAPGPEADASEDQAQEAANGPEASSGEDAGEGPTPPESEGAEQPGTNPGETEPEPQPTSPESEENMTSREAPDTNEESAPAGDAEGSNPNSQEGSAEGADTNKKPDNEGGPSPEQDEAKFMADLDAEELEFPTGYDFPGMPKWFNERERKVVARFINQARGELGDDDRVAVVNRAMEIMASATVKAGGNVASLYKRGSELLGRLRQRAEEKAAADDSSEKSQANKLFDNLDAETGTYQYALWVKLGGYSPQAVKLATRAVREAKQSVTPRAGEDGAAVQARTLRQAMVLVSSGPGAMQGLINEAMTLLSSSLPMRRQSPFGKNAWDK